MKIKATKTHQGWELSATLPGSRFPLYVKSVCRGKVKWSTDYIHAKHYKTKESADMVIRKIKSGEYA